MYRMLGRRLRWTLVCWLTLGAFGESQAGELLSNKGLVIKEGTQVVLEYTLSLEDRTVLESNVGKEPITYRHGAHEIVPGLERSLEGSAKGAKKRVVVKPVDGYGDVDPKAIKEVKKSMIPEAAWKVGVQLEAKNADGQTMFPRVTAVKEETVELDFNHPLAGKTLYFDVTVVDVRSAPAGK